MNGFYCFMFLLIMSTCEASRLNMSRRKLKAKKILSSSNRNPLKSIKSPDGDISDCVLTSHQLAFNHPLLKNHTIQLWHPNGRCPKGTVPVRRTKQEDIIKASSGNSFVKKQRKSFSQLPLATKLLNAAAHEHSYATVQGNMYYGTQATINVWNPPVQDPNEFSLSQIWILGGPQSDLNTIEAGWIVYPHLFGDNNTTLFTYWTDPKQNLWWLKYGPEIIVYWPTSLFQYLTDGASWIEWAGEIINDKLNGQHTTTKMGSGRFAKEGYKGASYFRNLQVVDGSNILRPPGVITVIAEQPNCYNILLQNNSDWADYFFYGGRGRNPNCP
ncbi:hypothetical protein ACH5RR_000613 [Cinchona calisaya]|uniref:Neprosin PEP catalytic domain-containing protein n=1 Tax=Cinchona calisaya TaxID=153742 RepID=A0ABD3B130_9GENT